MSTLLEHAKESALDIITDRDLPTSIISLISPRAQQIRSLEFHRSHWRDIITFFESTSQKLQLLHTLKIIYPSIFASHG